MAELMKAVRFHSYGGQEVLIYEDAPRPGASAIWQFNWPSGKELGLSAPPPPVTRDSSAKSAVTI